MTTEHQKATKIKLLETYFKKELPEQNLLIRLATQNDLGFIFNTWLKTSRNSFGKGISNTIYYKEHHHIITQAVLNGRTVIVCPMNSTNNIWGFMNWTMIDGLPVINFIYFRMQHQKQGLAKLLLKTELGERLNAAKVFYTEINPGIDKDRLPDNWVYNPYLLFYQKDENIWQEKNTKK